MTAKSTSLTDNSLSDRVASAGRWRFAGALVGAAAQFSIGVVLARLLVPADFGVVALASVILGFMQPLGDLGLGGAVVQRSELSDRHIRVAFTSWLCSASSSLRSSRPPLLLAASSCTTRE